MKRNNMQMKIEKYADNSMYENVFQEVKDLIYLNERPVNIQLI